MATLDHIYGAHQLENESSDDEEAHDEPSAITETDSEDPVQPGSPSKSVLTDVEEEDLEAEDEKQDEDEDARSVKSSRPGTAASSRPGTAKKVDEDDVTSMKEDGDDIIL